MILRGMKMLNKKLKVKSIRCKIILVEAILIQALYKMEAYKKYQAAVLEMKQTHHRYRFKVSNHLLLHSAGANQRS